MQQSHTINKKLAQVLFCLLAAIVVLLPFHAFFTTWLGSAFGNLLVWRAWKEFVLAVGVVVALLLCFRDHELRRTLIQDQLMQVGTIFSLWLLLVTCFLLRDYNAAVLGLIIQLRLFVAFLLARIVVFYRTVPARTVYWLVLIPAVVVTLFGLLQMFVLPRDFLAHFGYQKNVTIPPFFTIDEQLTRLRAFSTLRGPNPLGVYLILPIVLSFSLLPSLIKKSRRYLPLLILPLASLILLYGSHSRSAWLGLIGATVVYGFLSIPKRWRQLFVASGLLALCITGVVLHSQRHTSFIQDVILHDNPQTGGAISSDEGHAAAIKSGLEDVQKSPWYGCGAGCAGPASFHNAAGAKISENYFLQTAQEGGLIALALLGLLFAVLVWRLWQTDTRIGLSLLSICFGVCIASMFSHAWADDTIAYLWWLLAGFVVYTKNTQLKTENEHDTKQTKVTTGSNY